MLLILITTPCRPMLHPCHLVRAVLDQSAALSPQPLEATVLILSQHPQLMLGALNPLKLYAKEGIAEYNEQPQGANIRHGLRPHHLRDCKQYLWSPRPIHGPCLHHQIQEHPKHIELAVRQHLLAPRLLVGHFAHEGNEHVGCRAVLVGSLVPFLPTPVVVPHFLSDRLHHTPLLIVRLAHPAPQVL